MTELPGRAMAAGTSADLGELCARAAELVRELPGPVRRVALRTGDHGVDIEWSTPDEQPAVAAVTAPPALPHEAAGAPADLTGAAGGSGASGTEDAGILVRAPLVGTYYAAPQPGAAPFVAVGDAVQPGQTLGLVEAMKLMNHVTAEVGGRVVEILVANRDPVEFDQALIRLAPL